MSKQLRYLNEKFVIRCIAEKHRTQVKQTHQSSGDIITHKNQGRTVYIPSLLLTLENIVNIANPFQRPKALTHTHPNTLIHIGKRRLHAHTDILLYILRFIVSNDYTSMDTWSTTTLEQPTQRAIFCWRSEDIVTSLCLFHIS